MAVESHVPSGDEVAQITERQGHAGQDGLIERPKGVVECRRDESSNPLPSVVIKTDIAADREDHPAREPAAIPLSAASVGFRRLWAPQSEWVPGDRSRTFALIVSLRQATVRTIHSPLRIHSEVQTHPL